MPNPELTRVFHALSDTTRRTVLERLTRGPAAVSELARPFKMALPSFVQHLGVLEEARARAHLHSGAAAANGRRALAFGAARPLGAASRFPRQFPGNTQGAEAMTGTITHKPDPKLDLVLERVVDVAPDLVWAAWTRPEHITQWFTPAPWQTVDCEIDLRPGGIFRFVMRSPEGQEFPNTGCYLEVIENEKPVCTAALEPGYRRKTQPPR